MAIRICFESNQVSNDDVFQNKREEYEKQRNSARKRGAVRLDADGDNALDEVPYDLVSFRMIRR